MSDPVQPSAIYAPDGSRVRYRAEQARAEQAGAAPATAPPQLPARIRAIAIGPLLTVSAAAVASVVAARGAEVVGRLVWGAVRGAHPGGRGSQPTTGISVSWTYVEIRWPS